MIMNVSTPSNSIDEIDHIIENLSEPQLQLCGELFSSSEKWKKNCPSKFSSFWSKKKNTIFSLTELSSNFYI